MRLVMKCRGAELEDEIELATVIELTTRPMPNYFGASHSSQSHRAGISLVFEEERLP